MPKFKKIVIEIDISNTGFCGVNVSTAPLYKINLNKNELVGVPGAKLHYFAAHEIGHVIAHAFDLPHSSRMNEPHAFYEYQTDKNFRLSVETEAWDVAEMMAVKHHALQTHRRYFEDTSIDLA